MKSHIRIIGDCHCVIVPRAGGRSYRGLIEGAEYSVQIGDLGFPHRKFPIFHEQIDSVDKSHHVVVLGNHDDYTKRASNALGDFGTHSFPLENGNFEFFYIRGAYSPDRMLRTIGIDWWEDEQLTYQQGWAAIELYEKIKPSIVITHDCPQEILHLFYGGDCKVDRTNSILQNCFEIHRPTLWIFGHHHRNWKNVYKDTTFICLDGEFYNHQMGYLDFDNQGNLVGGPF